MHIRVTKIGVTVGMFSVAVFVICMGWGVLLAAPELKQLHIQLLQVFYPGFNFTAGGIILGFVEAFVYGWLAGVGFLWLCKKICA